jgi:hypothetical protein
MFFIYGWGHKKKALGEGAFQCPVCRTQTRYVQFTQRRWFSFFFVPLLPISGAKEFVVCQQCVTPFAIEAIAGNRRVQSLGMGVSGFAIGGVITAVLALFSFCIFFISLPLAITAVILGHLGLREVQRNEPRMEGKWQAIGALIVGYPAMLLALTSGCFILLGPMLTGGDKQSSAVNANRSMAAGASVYRPSQIAEQGLDRAESEIASKGDRPAGRGNSPEAIELANRYASRLKELSDSSFRSSRKPLLQLSGGEYVTYCQLQRDRCLFLVHVPSYRNFSTEAKKALAALAWNVAEVLAVENLEPGVEVGVGLRGTLLYGDIMIGKVSDSVEQSNLHRNGEREDLLSFFEPETVKEDLIDVAAQQDVPKSVQNNVADEAVEENTPTIASTPADTDKDELEAAKEDDVEMKNPFEVVGTPQASQEIVEQWKEKDADRSPDAASDEESMVLTQAEDDKKGEEPKEKPKTAEPVFQNQIPLRLERNIESKAWAFTALAFSPDGRWIAAGRIDQSLHVYEVATGALKQKFDGLDSLGVVTAVAFSRSGEYLVAAGDQGGTLSWRVSSDGLLSSEEEMNRIEKEVSSLVTSPSRDFFMGVSKQGNIVWQPFGEQKLQVRKLQEFEKEVAAIWLPESGTTAMATNGEKLVKFDLKNGAVLETDELGIKGATQGMFSRDGKRLVLGVANNVRLLQFGQGKGTRLVKLPPSDLLYSLSFHPNGRWFATGNNGKVRLWDFESGDMLAQAGANSIFYQQKMAFSADGRYLASTSSVSSQPIHLFRIGEDRTRE